MIQASNVPPISLTALHVNFHGGFNSVMPPIGPAGCTVLTPQISLPTVGILGIAYWYFPIPNDPNIEGLKVYVQAAIAKPGGAVLGLADLSNRFAFLIGNNLNANCGPGG